MTNEEVSLRDATPYLLKLTEITWMADINLKTQATCTVLHTVPEGTKVMTADPGVNILTGCERCCKYC